MSDETLYEYLGGDDALVRFSAALTERCHQDPVLAHAFSHGGNPDHVRNLAWYLAEVLGGPPRYSAGLGGHSAMLERHAREGSDDEFSAHFISCFMAAADDADLPRDERFRSTLRRFIEHAQGEVDRYAPFDAVVPPSLPMPHWEWSGPVTPQP